jgi:hypothetical protein
MLYQSPRSYNSVRRGSYQPLSPGYNNNNNSSPTGSILGPNIPVVSQKMSDGTIRHSQETILKLNKLLVRLKINQLINAKSNEYYSRWSDYLVYPSIAISAIASIASFMSTSEQVSTPVQNIFVISVGVISTISTAMQSISSAAGYNTRADAFLQAADAYSKLGTFVQFEIDMPDEDKLDFFNKIETMIIDIEEKRKYLPPLSIIAPIMKKYYQNQEKNEAPAQQYQQQLHNQIVEQGNLPLFRSSVPPSQTSNNPYRIPSQLRQNLSQNTQNILQTPAKSLVKRALSSIGRLFCGNGDNIPTPDTDIQQIPVNDKSLKEYEELETSMKLKIDEYRMYIERMNDELKQYQLDNRIIANELETQRAISESANRYANDANALYRNVLATLVNNSNNSNNLPIIPPVISQLQSQPDVVIDFNNIDNIDNIGESVSIQNISGVDDEQ